VGAMVAHVTVVRAAPVAAAHVTVVRAAPAAGVRLEAEVVVAAVLVTAVTAPALGFLAPVTDAMVPVALVLLVAGATVRVVAVLLVAGAMVPRRDAVGVP